MSRRNEYRSRGTLQERPIVFVMGDGPSEETSFEGLNDLVDGIKIRAVPLKVAGWKKIIDKCDKFVRTNGVDLSRDIVAIVTDEDKRYDTAMMERFERECERKGYRLYLSNISFEVWLLMHYEVPRKPMTQEELEKRLEHHLGHPYVKSESIPLTSELLEEALRNADAGQGSPCSGTDCLGRNPSTMVDGLVKYILKLQSRGMTVDGIQPSHS